MAECEQDSQPAREQRKRYRILLSSFSPEEKTSLSNIIKDLGGIYFDTPNFVASCTHIICGKPNRGEKFLCGCALGKWILRKEFLLDSHNKQNWLEENMYEWDSNKDNKSIPMSHILAPTRWRSILSKNSCDTRPFDQWRAIVAVSDAKRRQAYKRLLEAGGASVVNGKPPYDTASLAGKLTHVFTERNLEPAIAGLRKAGLPCLSPDYIPEYILRDPIPQASEFDIKSYNPKSAGQSTVVRCQGKVTTTPTLPLGCSLYQRTRSSRNKEKKENSQTIVCQKEPECHQSNAMKRKKKLPAGLSPSSKKTNKGMNFLNTDWLNVSTHCNIYQSKSTKVGSATLTKTRRKAQFGSYIRNAVDSCLEENVVNGALGAICSFLSSSRFPPAVTVHTVMQDILLKSPSTALSNKAYSLLQQLLYLHPPSVNRELYQMALMAPQECSGTDMQMTGTLWEFVRKPIRFLLGLDSKADDTQTVEQGEASKLESSLLLLKFLVSLLEKDFGVHVGPCRESSNKRPLVWIMFWPNGSGLGTNCEVRELIKFTWTAIGEAKRDSHKVPLVHLLQSLVAMTAQCCRDADKSECLVIGERADSIAADMSMACRNAKSDPCCLKLWLETCRPSWLRFRVAELQLNHYDDCLVPNESRFLLSFPISLSKIVRCYFFLLPKVMVEGTKENCCEKVTTSQAVKSRKRRGQPLQVIGDANHPDGFFNSNRGKKPKKPGINRRNIKGETKLHAACISNNVTLVRQLLRDGADVNVTDYAGWTPLHEACNHGNNKCVQEILRARTVVFGYAQDAGLDEDEAVDLLAAPLDGTTLLHDAVSNGHMDVVKLLLSVGGARLLEAKQANGCRPVDVAESEEMRQYLNDQMTCLQTKTLNSWNSTLSHVMTESLSEDRLKLLRPTDEMYKKVLEKKGKEKRAGVSVQKCEDYLLVLSHLVQGYAHLRQLPEASLALDGSGHDLVDDDLCDWRDFRSHVNNLQLHITRIAMESELSPLSCVQLAAMCAYNE